MFYIGFCDLCNYLDADLNEADIWTDLFEHQEKSHGKIQADAIHVRRIHQPLKLWVEGRKDPSFWQAWRMRKKTAYILNRLEELKID